MRGGFPSMTALLGLLAVAGYQNRDKLQEMLRNAQGPGGTGTGGGAMPGGLGGLLGGLMGGGAGAQGGGLGGLLGGGLGELDRHMRGRQRGEAMDSWVGTGPNRELPPRDLEDALGDDVIADLQEATGLSRQEIVDRLSRELPSAVDRYTPDGRLPDRSTFG